jgi:plasmid stabilization system protein ParE
MNYPLLVRPEAEIDITQAFGWYEARKPGLGFEFMKAVDEALTAVQPIPLAFATVHRQVRRVLLKRFPYCIYYVLDSDVISVIACFHAKQAPSGWKSRVP